MDAYYGPDSLRTKALAESLSVGRIKSSADSLITILGDRNTPPYSDSLVRLRHEYLRTQLKALSARAGMLGDQKLSFDQEAQALYDVLPPHYSDAHFDSLLARLDSQVPGPGVLARRFQRFRDRLMIPPARVDTVFRTAIAACRARTLAHMKLPSGERFDLEYVKGTPWNAYNWYKGNYRSLIQVNLDFPIPVDRAIDLACHEGYPGHHAYNARLEESLVKGRGWLEFSIYPLFTAQSLIAEGSANFGIDMAFPASERTEFERDSLFPLAGLDTSLALRNAGVREVVERLNYARNEVARRYLDGQLDSTAARQAMSRYWLIPPRPRPRRSGSSTPTAATSSTTTWVETWWRHGWNARGMARPNHGGARSSRCSARRGCRMICSNEEELAVRATPHGVSWQDRGSRPAEPGGGSRRARLPP